HDEVAAVHFRVHAEAAVFQALELPCELLAHRSDARHVRRGKLQTLRVASGDRLRLSIFLLEQRAHLPKSPTKLLLGFLLRLRGRDLGGRRRGGRRLRLRRFIGKHGRGSEGRDNGRACEDEWFHGVSPEKGTAIRGECGSPSARSKHLLPGAHSRRVRRVARGVAVLVLLLLCSWVWSPARNVWSLPRRLSTM